MKIETGEHFDIFNQVNLTNATLEIESDEIFNVVSGTVNLNDNASIISSGAIFLHDSTLKIDGSITLNENGLNVRAEFYYNGFGFIERI